MSGKKDHNPPRGRGRGARGGKGNSNRGSSPPPPTMQPRVSPLASRVQHYGAAHGQEGDTDKPAVRFLKVNHLPPHFAASMHVAWGHVKDPHIYPNRRTCAALKSPTSHNPLLNIKRPPDPENTFTSPLNFLSSIKTSSQTNRPRYSKHSSLNRADPQYPVRLRLP